MHAIYAGTHPIPICSPFVRLDADRAIPHGGMTKVIIFLGGHSTGTFLSGCRVYEK
jgi:hypothetical protein